MKTLEIIAAAAAEYKNVATKEFREANKEFTSISSVLKFMQSDDMPGMRDSYLQVLAELGVAADVDKTGKSQPITPKQIFDVLADEQYVIVRSGGKKNPREERMAGIWVNQQVRDPETKEKLYDAEGKPIVEQVCRPIKTWSPSKIVKLLSQAVAFYDSEREDAVEEAA